MGHLPPRPADEPLFGNWARDVAESQQRDAGFRWLVQSADAEAAGLRVALEQGFALAGDSRDALAKGLAHERWGQHAGARGHLLALALCTRLGLSITCEPNLGRKSPDLLVERDGAQALIEVRAMTGCGEEPWDGASPSRRSAPARTAPGRPLRTNGRASSEKDQRRRARVAAVERAKAEAALQRDLNASVAHAITHKLEVYSELVEQVHLPFVVALYQDTDAQLGELVSRWALGGLAGNAGGAGGAGNTGNAASANERGARGNHGEPGAWERAPDRFAPLSAVLVFGRDTQLDGTLTFRGERIDNPCARHPLPGALLPAGIDRV